MMVPAVTIIRNTVHEETYLLMNTMVSQIHMDMVWAETWEINDLVRHDVNFAIDDLLWQKW